jgi:type II secretory ATPase GspE/PulE/Tfp pilus assembly ATPase PilB-like protein
LLHQEATENLFHGFYAIPTNQESGYSRIFFSRTGIINRKENNQPGEILNEAGDVPKEKIESALCEEERLRKRKVGEIISERFDIPQESIDEAVKKRKAGEIISEQFDIPQESIDKAVNEVKNNNKYASHRIGEILVSFGLVSREQVDTALKNQKLNKKKQIGEILVENKIITAQELLMALALKFRMSIVNLDDILPDPQTIDLIKADTVRKFNVFPVASTEKKITIATSSFVNLSVLDILRFCTNRWVELVLASRNQITSYIDKYYEDEDDNCDVNIDDAISEMGIEDQDQDQSNEISLKDEAKAAPIIRLANKTLLDGVRAGASDIHILPQQNELKVSFRVNGLLQQHMRFDMRVHKILIARFKIISNMDISERRLPQDGRFKVKINKRDIEFRVSSMPSQHGETLVLRILDKSCGPVSLDQLGLDAKDAELINHIVRSSHGMLLVTGSTGSGKSTTLASVLRGLAGEPKHVLSLEDPIEIDVSGINQIQVHEKIGFSFARALRNVLRHDPDIIMVGEIRDHDTAMMAVQAALTGHVLLSTLHTNNAASAFTRLCNMGVEPYLASATVKGVITQQLLPKLCEKCRSTRELGVDVVKFIASHGIDTKGLVDHFSTGCDDCSETGISGRVLVYEFMNVTLELQKLITQGAPAETLQETACRLGMRPIVNMAIEASKEGLVSIDRILPLFIE